MHKIICKNGPKGLISQTSLFKFSTKFYKNDIRCSQINVYFPIRLELHEVGKFFSIEKTITDKSEFYTVKTIEAGPGINNIIWVKLNYNMIDHFENPQDLENAKKYEFNPLEPIFNNEKKIK